MHGRNTAGLLRAGTRPVRRATMGSQFGCDLCTDDKVDEDGQPKSKTEIDAMYYDEEGVLRAGVRARDRDAELRSVLLADNPEQDSTCTWCVVDSNWINAWLAFVHFNQYSPAPGNINNGNLIRIIVDETGKHFRLPKEGLELASTSKPGHFRLVRESVWNLYCDLYPGSGPKITVVGELPEDTSTWSIDLKFYDREDTDNDNSTANIMMQPGVTREDLHLDTTGEEDHLFFSDEPAEQKKKATSDPATKFLFGEK